MNGVTGEPTKQVHVFAERWALQGDGYEAVTFAKGRYSPMTFAGIGLCFSAACYTSTIKRLLS